MPIADKSSRQASASALAKVKKGMPENEVSALLGIPDDIRTQNDPGGISTTRTREIWMYGTDGHLTFPSLGCVYIDDQGKVQYVYGGTGEPPDTSVLPEKELRNLLRLIDKAPSYNSGYQYNPLYVIQIVNALQPLGKEKALAAIDEYLRITSHFHSPGREGVFLVLRVLFDIPDDPGYMPPMLVGAPEPAAPRNLKRLPRFPILLQDDVPLLLVTGYTLGGKAEQPESHVTYFREHGQIRSKPLVPGNAPLALMDTWKKNTARLLYSKDNDRNGTLLIANQLLNMIDSVHQRDVDRHGFRFWPVDNVEERWKSVEAQVAKLAIRWNREQDRYTFEDGTCLPEPVRKFYRRHIWDLDGLNGEAELIVERQNDKYISVNLRWSGMTARKIPHFTLTLFPVKDKAKTLVELTPTSIGGVPGDESFSSQTSLQVELAERTEIQARLKIEEHERVSPVYNP